MQILLWQDVEKLGKRGDIVAVADGYARNYLLPRKMASRPTPQAHRDMELEKKRVVKRQAKLVEDLKTIAATVSRESVTIEVNTNEEGHLYGSVTPATIAEAYAPMGVKVDPSWIHLDDPIKSTGVYQVKIRIREDIETTAKVWVVQSKDVKKPKTGEKESSPAGE